MRPISLTARRLGQWLAEQGSELREAFWQRLQLGCNDCSVFDYQFVVDQVPWRGAVRVSASFVQHSKLRISGWPVASLSDQLFPDDEVFVVGLVMEVLISYPHRLQRPSNWLTPHMNQPEYGIRIESPTIVDLDTAWRMLLLVTPRMYSVAETMTREFEREVMSRCYPVTSVA